MPFGTTNQINQLTKAARGSRNVGNRPTYTATLKSPHSATVSSQAANYKTGNVTHRGMHPGSSAGYEAAKSAHLTPNNSGYYNPAYQSARYTKNTLSHIRTSSGQNPVSISNKLKSSIKDYRIASKSPLGNSAQKLAKILNPKIR